MKQYLLLIHPPGETIPSSDEWEDFFEAAHESGTFRGGSEVGNSELIGPDQGAKLSNRLAGYMRFDSDEPNQIRELLKLHPVVVHGGTVELCELPESWSRRNL